MREIEFRGKRTCDNEWTYGWFIGIYQTEDGDVGCIRDYTGKDNLVKLETVGQYTGLKDKNGKKIFEGDIVGCFCNTQIFQVKWCDIRGGYFLDDVVMCGGSEPAPECLGNLVDTIEVIGNVFDNGDLTIEKRVIYA